MSLQFVTIHCLFLLADQSDSDEIITFKFKFPLFTFELPILSLMSEENGRLVTVVIGMFAFSFLPVLFHDIV